MDDLHLPEIPPMQAPPSQESGRQYSILVVEDSEEDFEVIRWAFRRLGVNITMQHCIDGDETIDYLYGIGKFAHQTRPSLPDIILLDLNLPGTDGREVLQQIKQDEILKRIPVVVLTTSLNPKDIQSCYENGANSYVLKPVNLQRYLETLKTIVSYWFETVVLDATAKQGQPYAAP
jgi:CheY-like chemotaxis protein